MDHISRAEPTVDEKKQPVVTEQEQDADSTKDSEANHNPKGWHGAAAVPEVKDWKEEIQIQKPRKQYVKDWIVNLLFLVFPLLFVGLGVAVAALNGRPLRDGHSGWLAVLKEDALYFAISNCVEVAVTVFPIGFGIILCKTLKSIATYKAQEGTRLITLEQLVASKSFGSSLTGFMTFKRVNKAAILLCSIWLMSPLTTQSLQRLFSTGIDTYKTTIQPVQYLDTTASSFAFGSGDAGPYLAYTTQIYGTVMSMPDTYQNETLDVFGNPKIPLLSDAEGQFYKDSEGWYVLGESDFALWKYNIPIKNASATVQYSSLVGLALAGLQPNNTKFATVSNFTTQSTYLTLQCSPFEITTAQNFSKEHPDAWTNIAPSFASEGADMTSVYASLAVDVAASDPLHTIVFASKYINGEHPIGLVSVTKCKVSQQTVEVEMVCASKACTAFRIRAAAPALNSFESMPEWLNFWPRFLSANTPPNTSSALISSLLETWLVHPDNNLYAPGADVQTVNVSSIPIDVFASRLSVAVTTFYQAGVEPTFALLGVPESFPEGESFMYKTTNATVREERLVYECHWGWLGALLLSCLVVIAVVVVNAYLQSKILGPDILGYVSTMTHDNKFIPVPKGGSAITGIERTIKLADLKLRLQDVQPNESVGQIALASVEGQHLKEGRRYF